MEQLSRHQASRKGLKSHVTRLYNKIDDLVDKEVDEYSIALLTKAMEQLQDKCDKLNKIDEQIITLIDEPQGLEDYIMESEDLKDDIADKLTRVQTFIDIQKQPKNTSPPTNQPQVSQSVDSTSPPQSVTTVSRSSEAQISANLPSDTSPPQLDGVAGANNIAVSSNSVTTTLLTPPVQVQQTSNVVSSLSLPETLVISNVAPPPLIPLAPTTSITSFANHQSSVLLSVPDARSLYTTSVDHFTHHSLFPTPAAGYHASTQQFATSRLPKLSLPTFSGDPLTWQTFWDSFYAAIDANPNLSGIQKFNYLKAQLQGNAARAIGGLPLTDRNYVHAITLVYGVRLLCL
ncbi:mucin-17-like isoform X1 [Dysidea avara]|uniref:mucin-17-like isoform X1 n=1 Tax=Dysidea avara TaxID=196820 RepID=UPI00331CF01C